MDRPGPDHIRLEGSVPASLPGVERAVEVDDRPELARSKHGPDGDRISLVHTDLSVSGEAIGTTAAVRSRAPFGTETEDTIDVSVDRNQARLREIVARH